MADYVVKRGIVVSFCRLTCHGSVAIDGMVRDFPSTAFRAMKPPTDRQLKVLAAIHRSIMEHGYPPTYREIGELLGIRPGSRAKAVSDHLRALRSRGLLEGRTGVARALRVTEAGLRALGETWRVPVTKEEWRAERRCQGCGCAYFGGECPMCAREAVA